MNVTIDSLKKIHGDDAPAKFREIANLGGFGAVKDNYDGGLDLTDVLSGDNKAVSASNKKKILEIISPEANEPEAPAEGEKATPQKNARGGSNK